MPGTAGGGYRIVRTMGHKMVRLLPVNGFAAETSAALVISAASGLGIPVSTTQVISSSITGVGATRRLSAVKWGVVGRIVWAWVLTLPVTALAGYAVLHALRLAGIYSVDRPDGPRPLVVGRALRLPCDETPIPGCTL